MMMMIMIILMIIYAANYNDYHMKERCVI